MHSVNGSVITITRQGAAEELTFEVTGGRKSRSEVRNETRLHHQRVKSSGHSTAQKLPQHRAVWGVHKKSERVRKRPSKWENAALYQTFCQKPHFTWNKTKNDNERKGNEIKINTEDESRNYNETSGTQSNESLIPQRHHLVLLHLLPIYSTMTGKIPSAVKSICPLLTYMFKLKSWFGLSVRSWSVFPLPVPESRLRPLCSHSQFIWLAGHRHHLAAALLQVICYLTALSQLPCYCKVFLSTLWFNTHRSPVSHLGYKRWPAQSPRFVLNTCLPALLFRTILRTVEGKRVGHLDCSLLRSLQ